MQKQLLFINDVEKVIGRSRITLRRWWSNGKFPKPTKLNGTDLVWHADTINQWIVANVEI